MRKNFEHQGITGQSRFSSVYEILSLSGHLTSLEISRTDMGNRRLLRFDDIDGILAFTKVVLVD